MSQQRNGLGQFIRGANGHTFEGRGIWHDHKGYPCIWINDHSVKLHVYIWERAHGPKPNGYEVHHIDLNKDHYALGNLALETNSDHQKLHAGWIRVDGQWAAKPCSRCGLILPFSEFYPRKGYTPSARCKLCHNIAVKERLTRLGPDVCYRYKHDYYIRRTEGLVKTRRLSHARA